MKKNLLLGAMGIIVAAGIGYALVQNQMSGTATSTPVTANDTTGAVQPPPPGATTVTTIPPVTDNTPKPGKPIATTNATVAPTDTTAVVTGTVNPNGAMSTYWYEYGTTKNLGMKTKGQVVGSGFTATAAPGYITGLTKETMYYFKLVAQNQFGTVSGQQNSFTTSSFSSLPVGGIPAVTTVAAGGITSGTATLKGTVNPNKTPTKYWFEIGKNGTLGGVTILTATGDGSAVVPASAQVAGLEPATTYYFRINAQNQYGTVNGAILTFKTSGKATSALPVVNTLIATSVGSTTATVAGTVNPSGAETSYWFEYSTNSKFTQSKTTSKKSAGADSSTASVQAVLSGLKSATTYYVRIVAQNPGGTVKGDSQTFQTK